MLSILIPTYNYNCYRLIKCLNDQALVSEKEYEIIVIDDCSSSPHKENNEINNLPNCSYTELNNNIGRARIRNLLASKAKFDFFLFLDCDASISSDLFLNRYLSYCNKNSVVCGGTAYNQQDIHSEYILRLKYGISREQRSVEEREEVKYTSFSSFNFLIPKSIFDSIRFNEKIIEYGHEDTVFGYELKLHNYNILHIDNPLIHEGLEPAPVFLQKTKKSMENLCFISQESKYQKIIVDIKVLRVYRLFKKYKLTNLYIRIFLLFSKLIEKNLLGKRPFILLLDLYKLGHLSLTYKS